MKYLEEYPLLITGKMNPKNVPEDLTKLWEELSLSLNSCGDGPIRTSPEWKKVMKHIF